MSSAASNMVKSVKPAFWSLMAMHRPLKPAPTMPTDTILSTGLVPYPLTVQSRATAVQQINQKYRLVLQIASQQDV
jgi:hypothetical protein